MMRMNSRNNKIPELEDRFFLSTVEVSFLFLGQFIELVFEKSCTWLILLGHLCSSTFFGAEP